MFCRQISLKPFITRPSPPFNKMLCKVDDNLTLCYLIHMHKKCDKNNLKNLRQLGFCSPVNLKHTFDFGLQ